MPFQINHSVGYKGICKLADKYLLCTGGNIALTQDPIMGSGVWGAGYNVAGPISYAWNYLQLEGSANFELTTAGEWSNLVQFAYSQRTSGKDITLKPDGVNGFFGKGYCSSISFDGSQGSAVTGTFNFKGNPAPEGTNGASGIVASLSPTQAAVAGNAGFAGAKLIAYWKTNVFINGTKKSNIVSWNCSCNADLQLLKCCNSESSAPKTADYVLLGELNSDASVTYFGLKGEGTGTASNKNFNLTEIRNINTQKNLVFNMNGYSVTIPLFIINNSSTSMTTGSGYITTEVSYTGLSDAVNGVFRMA